MNRPLEEDQLHNILTELMSAMLNRVDLDDPNFLISLIRNCGSSTTLESIVANEDTPVGLFLYSFTSDSFIAALSEYYLKLLNEKSRRYYDFYITLHASAPSAQSKLMLGVLKSMRNFLEKSTNFRYDFEADYKKNIKERGEHFIQKPIDFLSETFVRLLWEDVNFLEQYYFNLQIYCYDAPKNIPVPLISYLKSGKV